jgi:hypothetical protein
MSDSNESLNWFWRGFYKKADAASGLTGGEGHTGAGKGVIGPGTSRAVYSGTEQGSGRADPTDTRTDHTLRDADRGPRDFGMGESGPEFVAEGNPHIRY